MRDDVPAVASVCRALIGIEGAWSGAAARPGPSVHTIRHRYPPVVTAAHKSGQPGSRLEDPVLFADGEEILLAGPTGTRGGEPGA
jgi:hypothetical protein